MAAVVLVAMLIGAAPPVLTEDEAVATALTRSRDLVAAKLNIDAAEVDRVIAGILPNPVASYGLANLVVPPGNPQNAGSSQPAVNPGFFDQPIHTVSISQVIDIWFKRSKRREAADRGLEGAQLMVMQVEREVSWAVKTAFADALRAHEQRALAQEARERYDDTVRLSASRLKVGDISETDYKKIELELMRYKAAEIQAKLQSDLARQRLAALMTLPLAELPEALEPTARRSDQTLDLQAVISQANETRPDLQATLKSVERAKAVLASQRREAYPDISLSVAYSHDNFVVSGDNPNTFAVGISLPLPIFDRNQGGVGHAEVDLRTSENERERLLFTIATEVADAVKRSENALVQLKLLTDDVAPRAAQALKVAEKSYQAGAVSLLELLEAQRTYVEVRQAEVDATLQYRQAVIDLVHAVGGTPK
ncbi:MAG: TolC family protein [Myxococcaceae bacterium]